MGTPEYAAVSLRRLLEGPHLVVAVVTRPDKPRGRGQKSEPSPVKELAIRSGIEVLDPASARGPELAARLAELAADVGVVVAYGRILPKAVLEAPRLGCVNAHASLLPELRGAAPIERAILAGLARTGVTIMRMNEGLDEGDILFAREVAIDETTTGGALRETLATMSAEMLAEALDALAGGAIAARPQDHERATFAPPLRREEAAIDWNESADEVSRRVRAFAPRPGAFAFDEGTRLKILEARVVDRDRASAASAGSVMAVSAEGVVVACGRGAVELVQVQPEGKRPMRALDYERGRRGDGERRLDGGR